MLKVENIKGGKHTKEYCAKTEERLARQEQERKLTLMLDTKQYNEYCEKNGISKKEKHSFESYLNNGTTHYEARFCGDIKEVFGLDKYDRKAYEDLLESKLPISGGKFAELNPNVKVNNLETGDITKPVENKKVGVDFVANTPKSLSLHFALVDGDTRDKIVKAMDNAFDKQVKEMSKQIKPSTQRKEYMDFDPEATKMFVTRFIHQETRPDENDKSGLSKTQAIDTIQAMLHIHGHCNNFAMFGFFTRDKQGNKILDSNGKAVLDYKMLAIDQSELFKSQLLNSATFDTMLNSEINNIGIETEKHLILNEETGTYHETFKVIGYDREDEEKTSLRSQKIYEEAKKHNKSLKDRDYIKGISKNTRGTKLELSADELATAIKRNTLEVLGADKLDSVLKEQAQAKVLRLRQESSIEITEGKNKLVNSECFQRIVENRKFDTTGYMTEKEMRTDFARVLMTSRTFKDMNDLNSEIDKRMKDMSKVERGVNRLIKIKGGYTRLSNRLNEEGFRLNSKQLMSNGRPRTKTEIERDEKIFNKYVEMKKSQGFILNIGQEKSIRKNLGLGTETKIGLDIGDAGSGKSSSILDAAKYIWDEKYGKGKVIGISVGQSATKELKSIGIEDKKLINSTNFIMKAVIKNEDGTYKLNPKFVNNKNNHGNLYIFDEFGMEGSAKAYLITEIAKATNSSILCVGDHKQLQSPSYGNPFTVLKDELIKQDPNSVGRLDEVMRHRNDIGKKIAFAYRDKDTETLFNTLKDNDCLVTGKNEKEVMKEIAKDFMKMEVPVNQRIIVAKRNKTNEELNEKLREEIKKSDQTEIDFNQEHKIRVSRPTSQADITKEKEFAVGERVVFLKNAKELQNGQPKKGGWEVENNQLATIQGIKPLKNGSYDMTFKTAEDKEFSLNTADYPYMSHSYSLTVFKSQGKTRMEVLHYGEANTNYHEAYVAGSRHQGEKEGSIGYKLYIAEKDIDSYKQSITKEADRYTTLDSQECIQAEKEYLNFKTFEGQKGSDLPEKEIVQINKNELINGLDNPEFLKAEAELISNIKTDLKEMTPAEIAIFEKAIALNKKEQLKLSPEEIDKNLRDSQAYEEGLSKKTEGVETKEEADHILKEHYNEFNNKKSQEGLRKIEDKNNEWKPQPLSVEEPIKVSDKKEPVKNNYEKDFEDMNKYINYNYSRDIIKATRERIDNENCINAKIKEMEIKYPDMYSDKKFYEMAPANVVNSKVVIEGMSNSELKLYSEAEKEFIKKATLENVNKVERGISANQINQKQPLTDKETMERKKELSLKGIQETKDHYYSQLPENRNRSLEEQRRLEEQGKVLKYR